MRTHSASHSHGELCYRAPGLESSWAPVPGLLQAWEKAEEGHALSQPDSAPAPAPHARSHKQLPAHAARHNQHRKEKSQLLASLHPTLRRSSSLSTHKPTTQQSARGTGLCHQADPRPPSRRHFQAAEDTQHHLAFCYKKQMQDPSHPALFSPPRMQQGLIAPTMEQGPQQGARQGLQHTQGSSIHVLYYSFSFPGLGTQLKPHT